MLLGRRIATGVVLPIDGLAPKLFGKATRLAALLTLSGYGTFLTLTMLVAGVAVISGRLGLRSAAIVIGAQLASQASVRGVKRSFSRLRPAEWLFRQEVDFSYPSGHAVTGVAYYGGWLVLALASTLPLPLKTIVCAVLVCWALGIGWSRIALGAHHPSDVAGGMLVGGAFLCAEIALF